MKIKNKLLWLSITIIIIIDVISYFTAGTTERNPKINIPLFIIFLLAFFLFFFSLKDFIKKNKKGAVIGFFVGFILGVFSLGGGMFLLFFLIPIYGLIWNLVGCGGEDCWGYMIILSSVLLGLTGMLIGVYLQNKKIISLFSTKR